MGTSQQHNGKKIMNSSSAIKHAVTTATHHFIDMANERYALSLNYPSVGFTVRGTNGGTANAGTWHVNFNMGLLVDNMDEYLNQTIPHEVAHLVTFAIHGQEFKRTRRGMQRVSHGKNFYAVMRTFGVKQTRCHNMDVSNVKQATRKTKAFAVKCPCCESEFTVGTVRKNKILKGARYMHRCTGRKANAPIVLV